MISREEILAHTQYGVKIYGHILHTLYPGETVIYQVGRDCGLCRNPFAGGEKTMHIQRIKLHPEMKLSDEIARHEDINNSIPPGDCFDFAQLYYGLAGQDLLNKINEDMHLHLEEGYSPYAPGKRDSDFMIVPKVMFSFFKAPITNVHPHKNINLRDAYNYITGHFAKEKTEILRSITDTKRARNYKAANFCYCTFSGTFTIRNDNSLIEHSGLMCLDFDHVPDVEGLFQQLLQDEYFETQLLFRSPSGDGLKWIVPINTAEMPHREYFQAISNYVFSAYGVMVDKSGRDISRACFLPYDPNAYINPNL